MPVFQAAWMYYLSHPALVLNGLALFYAVCGSWLWIATQVRSARANARLATSPVSAGDMGLDNASVRVNRMFYAVGTVCLVLAVVLSLISTQL